MSGVILRVQHQTVSASLMVMWTGGGLDIRRAPQIVMKRWLLGGQKIRKKPQKTAALVQRCLERRLISSLASNTLVHR